MFNEAQALVYLESLRTPFFTELMTVITHLGGTLVLISVIATISLILFVKKLYFEAGMLVFGMLTGVAISQTIKLLVARSRPDMVRPLVEVSTLSFPSGHAMNNMLFYTLLVYLSWRLFRNKKLTIIFAVLVYFWVGLVSFSRLYLGVHYPSDIIAGLVLGGLVGLGVIWVGEKMYVDSELRIKRK